MKRLIIFISLIVVILLGYVFINKGVENGVFQIASYDTIEKKHAALTSKLANYDRINQDQFENAESTLNSSIKTYKSSKAKYEEILEELKDVLANQEQGEQVENKMEEVIYSDQETYKIDFLMVVLGNYGEKEGVDINFSLKSDSFIDEIATQQEYFLADLDFTVTGGYINVANFISYLENDDRLSWEINGFSMEEGEVNEHKGVTAKFTVKNVPIDSKSYIESNVLDQAETSDTTNTVSNTVANETTDSTNSTNSVDNTTGTDNTVSNTVANNTVN